MLVACKTIFNAFVRGGKTNLLLNWFKQWSTKASMHTEHAIPTLGQSVSLEVAPLPIPVIVHGNYILFIAFYVPAIYGT